ncbi:bacteriophage antitermination protein Q [Serratia symbiotica]|uniref:Phage Antitermination Protein Q family protein n=1 Tax=Serratia symbiotica SCt-VLC TaxID=1347341 RepID=A0A068R9D1_9GAMM|nr:bacteriophage antitermination protein Q [Serratia symbiotica]CDG47135.1 Phage Antitermination Protein Q family protein [Serratia symbiotica SCt-VLC]
MNTQQLEYVRLELTRALVDRSGGTKGQLEAFSEHPPANKIHSPRQPIYKVELEGERWVNADNAAVYVLETRSRRRPMPPIKDFEFAAAPWRRAINLLPEHEQAWLRYCYGFDLTFRYQTLICESIWNEHQKYLPSGLLRKTKKRIISLVWLAVQEVAALHMNDTYKEYAGALLATHLGVSRSTWCEIYALHWQRLKQAAEELDSHALHEVINRKQEHVFEELTA